MESSLGLSSVCGAARPPGPVIEQTAQHWPPVAVLGKHFVTTLGGRQLLLQGIDLVLCSSRLASTEAAGVEPVVVAGIPSCRPSPLLRA